MMFWNQFKNLIYSLTKLQLCINLIVVNIIQKMEMSNFNEEGSDYEQNKLDMAFIADDSREVRSVSMSGSEVQSISGISKIHSSSHPNSPFLNFQPEISSMEEWPKENLNLFGKNLEKGRSRKSPFICQSIQESSEDQQEIQKLGSCTKKRIGEKMKIITVGGNGSSSINDYCLRSKKSKVGEVQNLNPICAESSSQQIREIVSQIDGKFRSRVALLKNKNSQQPNQLNFLDN